MAFLKLEMFWSLLPAGFRFDPIGREIMEHIQAMCGDDGVGSHPLIHHFIPTLNEGVCSTHPDKLPGDAVLLHGHVNSADEMSCL